MSYAQDIKDKIANSIPSSVRAVIYARVSTDNEGQKESCGHQVEAAEAYAREHTAIKIIDTFVDDGISGKSDYNRPQYGKMLALIEDGEVDLVITKALSRLNRDELNSQILARLLVNSEATVLTLEDGQLHDFESLDSGIVHSLYYAIDAQYVKRQSQAGKDYQKGRLERKELIAKDVAFGYYWDKEAKKIRIHPDEAPTVLEIFEEYVFRNGSPMTIAEKLQDRKWPRRRKDKVTKEYYVEYIPLSTKTISNILSDERYIGLFHIGKRTSKIRNGKTVRIKVPTEEQVAVEAPELAIIDERVFALAQEIRESRQRAYVTVDRDETRGGFIGKHLFATKVFCSECGKPYRYGFTDRKKAVPLYRIKGHKCTNEISKVTEEELDSMLRSSLKHALKEQADIVNHLEDLLVTIALEDMENQPDKLALQKKKEVLEKEIDNLVTSLSMGGLNERSMNRIREAMNEKEAEIDELDKQMSKTTDADEEMDKVKEEISYIKKAIASLANFDKIDKQAVENYVERIEICPDKTVKIMLKPATGIRVDAGKVGIQDASDSFLANRGIYKNSQYLCGFEYNGERKIEVYILLN